MSGGFNVEKIDSLGIQRYIKRTEEIDLNPDPIDCIFAAVNGSNKIKQKKTPNKHKKTPNEEKINTIRECREIQRAIKREIRRPPAC